MEEDLMNEEALLLDYFRDLKLPQIQPEQPSKETKRDAEES